MGGPGDPRTTKMVTQGAKMVWVPKIALPSNLSVLPVLSFLPVVS